MSTEPASQQTGNGNPADQRSGKSPAALERYSKAVRSPNAGTRSTQDSASEDSISDICDIHQGTGELRIVIANDHRGFDAKSQLISQLKVFASQVIDLGSDGSRGCDYPDYAAPAARMVADDEADAAILLDGSGIGMGIVANKVAGVRAATAHDEITARVARENNHCNVLCVGVDLVSAVALKRIVDVFLSTEFAEG
ncbi:MAG: RpiB/LacA/LacB family sugar-phosphate isomerase, partial [Planctomycetota bacterium]